MKPDDPQFRDRVERFEENLVEIHAILDAIIAKNAKAAWRTAVEHVTMDAQATLKALSQGKVR